MIFLFMNSIEFLILFFFFFLFLIKISEHMMLLSFSFVEDANATCVYCYQSVDHFLAALFVSTCRVLRRHLLIVCCGFLELAIIASLSE